jgi:hypothetical protein
LMKWDPMNPAPPVTSNEVGVNFCCMKPPRALNFAALPFAVFQLPSA